VPSATGSVDLNANEMKNGEISPPDLTTPRDEDYSTFSKDIHSVCLDDLYEGRPDLCPIRTYQNGPSALLLDMLPRSSLGLINRMELHV